MCLEKLCEAGCIGKRMDHGCRYAEHRRHKRLDLRSEPLLRTTAKSLRKVSCADCLDDYSG